MGLHHLKRIAVIFLVRCAVIAADIIVLACTVTKTYRTWREGRRVGACLPATTCFLRDGKPVNCC